MLRAAKEQHVPQANEPTWSDDAFLDREHVLPKIQLAPALRATVLWLSRMLFIREKAIRLLGLFRHVSNGR